MSFRIATARAEQAPVLAGILTGWTDETRWMPRLHSAKEAVGFLSHLIDTRMVLVAETTQGVQGFIAGANGMVDALYVARGARGRGIGRALLARFKRLGPVTLWTFQANHAAQAFYAREGFVVAETTDGAGNDEKLPDVRLVWRG